MSLGRVFLLSTLLCATLLPAQSEKNVVEIAPGVTLPATGTIYGLDSGLGSAAKGPSLLQLHPTEILANTHAGSNFARSMVYAGPHSSIEIGGVSSAATFHTSQAVFYVRLGGDEPELLRNRVKILRLWSVKDRRVVSEFSMNIFGGHRKQQYDEIPASKSDVEGTNWLKLTPQSPLEPGEYGIVFMPKDPNFFADSVYDFNVAGDPAPKKK